MSAAPLPVDEPERLRSLQALDILDSPPEAEFEAIVRAAAAVCGVPISLVSLIDADRQWFKAETGLDGIAETPRDIAFCAHAVLGDELFEVADAGRDPRFADNPLVVGEPRIRFYAGMPLRLSDGARVGTLCVLDRTPRGLLPAQREVLELLGIAAVRALEARRDLRRLSQATASLQASETRFRVLSDGLPLGMFLADRAGQLVHANPRMHEILDLRPDQCLGLGWQSVVHPDDLARVREEVLRSMPLLAEHQLVHRLLRRDGSVASLHVRTRPIFAADGQPSGYVGSVEDATERLATAHRLATSETQLRWLYESTPAMLNSVDAAGRIVSVSDRWLARLGYRRDEVVGRLVTDFALPPPGHSATAASDALPPQSRLQELFAKGQLDDVPAQMVTRSGEILEVRLSAVVERDAAGSPLRGVAVLEDLTERLAAERAVRDEGRRLASIIEGTGAGTWEWNVATGEQHYNESWAAILGLSLAELGPPSYTTWIRLAHPDDVAEAKQQLDAHFEGRTPRYEVEVRLRHREGHWVWVLSRGRVLTWLADGSPEWMFGTHLDLTARKKQEDALRKSESFLNRTGQIAGIGGWEYDVESGALYWSDAVCRMLDHEPGHRPSLEALMGAYAPASRALIEAASRKMLQDGTGWDLELQLTTCRGRTIWMRNVAELEWVDGRPARLIGASQDVSSVVLQRQAVEQAKERLAIATDSGGIGIWEIDLRQQVLVFDALTCACHGLPGPAATVPIDEWLRWVHEEDRPRVTEAAHSAVQGHSALDIEFRIHRPDGDLRHMRATANATRGEDGRARRLIGANWDVTAFRQLSNQLAEQHELMRVTLQSIGDAVITTDAAGRVTWLNPMAERMTGWDAAEARQRPLATVFELIDEATREPVVNPVAACLERGERTDRGRPSVLLACDGAEYGVEDSAAPIRNERGEVFGAVLVFRDVTEQRRLAAEMSHRAMHDALTGLVNRAEFEARLGRLLAQAHSEQTCHTLLFIDLDQFKLVNDACGHSVGDQLLQQVSRLLTESVRESDTVARLGGDEFGIIVEHCPADQAERAAQSICDRMNDFRFEHGSKRFRVGASIGLVPLDARWASTATLLQAADTSCYAAKEAGRNRIHVWFDTDLAMRARHGEMKWATRLEQALDESRFVLFAQRIAPIHPSGRDGVHAEVLLRLLDADGSLVAPGAFLPAAERFHLSSRIDRWVLGAARDWLVALPDLAPIDTLCVNLSGQSIGDRAFHRHALEILAGAGPAICQRLCLEITETAAVTNLADAAVFIEKARDLGVRIALDDFGAGASSFGYLKKLKVDVLKIDGQFIRDFLDDPLDAAAVRCFVDVARVMGLKTVAEFVDRPEVLERLGAIGVDYAQGYLLHFPEAIDRLVDGGRDAEAGRKALPRSSSLALS